MCAPIFVDILNVTKCEYHILLLTFWELIPRILCTSKICVIQRLQFRNFNSSRSSFHWSYRYIYQWNSYFFKTCSLQIFFQDSFAYIVGLLKSFTINPHVQNLLELKVPIYMWYNNFKLVNQSQLDFLCKKIKDLTSEPTTTRDQSHHKRILQLRLLPLESNDHHYHHYHHWYYKLIRCPPALSFTISNCVLC